MTSDPRGPRAFEQMRDSPGRALGMTIAALVLCALAVVLTVTGYHAGGGFPWTPALLALLMLALAVANGARFVYNRRRARER